MRRVKTPREARGVLDLKTRPPTTSDAYNRIIAPRSTRHLRRGHFNKGMREVNRIQWEAWEGEVVEALHLLERQRFDRANSLYDALERVHTALETVRRREEDLARTSNYLQTLMDSMMDMLIVTDLNGIIIEANRTAERISGYGHEKLIRQPFRRFFTDSERAQAGVKQVLAKREVFDYELTLVTEAGREIPVMFNATVLEESDGRITGVLITARDITEIKRAEQALERQAQELARANADLEEFASVASHELQEPLQTIMRYASSLTERYRGEFDAQAKGYLNYMMDQTASMQALTNAVLTYARVEAETRPLELTDCEASFEQAMANLGAAVEESGVEVSHDPLPTVMADASQLPRVFQNLIGNAIKYCDTSKEQLRIHVSAKKEGSKWLFSVRDNGIGIDPEFWEDIFDMFTRLHPRSEIPGAGMGLAITERIVNRHGGRIWVESEPGEGSVFYFTIPENEGGQSE